MLKIEKFVTPSPEQWEIIIEGTRNPMNSWPRMDSKIINSTLVNEEVCPGINSLVYHRCDPYFSMGENDHDLMMRLSNGGPVHAKYRRMIPGWVTLTAPLYWWKEFDTYKVGTVANSCSTMHKIQAKEFTRSDFSCDRMTEDALAVLDATIAFLEKERVRFVGTKARDAWHNMIQLLPTSYNQLRTVTLNYEVLINIYYARRHHKLAEWHTLCEAIEKLPYAKELILIKDGDNE